MRLAARAERLLQQARGHRPQLRLQVGIARLDGALLAASRPAGPYRPADRPAPPSRPASRPTRRRSARRGCGSRTRARGAAEALMDLRHLAQDADPIGAVVDGLELRPRARRPACRDRPTAGRPARGSRRRGAARPARSQQLQRRDRLRLAGRPLEDLGVAIDRRRDVVRASRASTSASRSAMASRFAPSSATRPACAAR